MKENYEEVTAISKLLNFKDIYLLNPSDVYNLKDIRKLNTLTDDATQEELSKAVFKPFTYDGHVWYPCKYGLSVLYFTITEGDNHFLLNFARIYQTAPPRRSWEIETQYGQVILENPTKLLYLHHMVFNSGETVDIVSKRSIPYTPSDISGTTNGICLLQGASKPISIFSSSYGDAFYVIAIGTDSRYYGSIIGGGEDDLGTTFTDTVSDY